MDIAKNERTKDILLMLVAALLWSIGGVLVKAVPWSSLAIAGVRSVIAAAVIGLYMAIRRYRFTVNRRTLCIMLGLTCTYIPFVTATKLTTAANAIVLQFCAPLIVLLFNCVFRRQKLMLTDLLVVLLTTLGVAVCFLDGLGGGSALGNAIALLSGVGFATTLIASSGATDAERFSGLILGQALTACIGLPFYFAEKCVWSMPILFSLLALGVLQVGVAYILYALAARSCPPLACALLSALEPMLNPVWVAFFNGEVPGPLSLVGGVIIIGAVTFFCILSDRRSKRETAAA